MSQFIPVETPSGTILAEIEGSSDEQQIILTGLADTASQRFEDAAKALKENADYLMSMFKDLGPQEVTISFGISIGTEAGNPIFGLAKFSGQANYGMTLTWKACQDGESTSNTSQDI